MSDVYQIITDRILSLISESGELPWRRPWISVNGAFNRMTGRRYSLLNQLMLRHSGGYLTFNQVNSLGCKIRKGSKSEIVIFTKWPERTDPDHAEDEADKEEGETKKRTGPVLRYYRVFHESLIDGLEPSKVSIALYDTEPIAGAEVMVNGYLKREGIRIEKEMSDRAYYAVSTDTIHVPDIRQFEHSEAYYATVLHEMAHSTGHSKRLCRASLKQGSFGSQSYGMEELVSDLAACMICHSIGICSDRIEKNSAAYIQGWMKAIGANKKMFALAAFQAERAANYILDRSPVVIDSGEMREQGQL